MLYKLRFYNSIKNGLSKSSVFIKFIKVFIFFKSKLKFELILFSNKKLTRKLLKIEKMGVMRIGMGYFIFPLLLILTLLVSRSFKLWGALI